MANTGNKISGYGACSAPAANSLLLIVGNNGVNNFKVTLGTLLGNSSANTVKGNYVVLEANVAPETPSSDVGPVNGIWHTGEYLYVRAANGSIGRVLIDFDW